MAQNSYKNTGSEHYSKYLWISKLVGFIKYD